jgi:hypothetical protein
MGMQSLTPEYSAKMMERGLRFVLCGSVRGIISDGASEIVRQLKQGEEELRDR